MAYLDWLDPHPAETPLLCLSCMCPWSLSEPPQGPSDGCHEETCRCHESYWDTVPELTKRALWGDR